MSLQHAILGLLTLKPMTGYELGTLFNGSINYFWSAQLSQIYRDLGTLESKGYVTARIEPQKGKPDKKVYSITPEGDQTLEEWLNEFPEKLSMAIRDEITLRVFFGHRISSDELKFQLSKLIKEKQTVLGYLRTLEEQYKMCTNELECPAHGFYQWLTIKKGLIVFEAEIRWAEECLNALEARKAIEKET